MGFTSDQLDAYNGKLVSSTDKLQAVFDDAVKQVGQDIAADKLLEACRSIECPTIGAVVDMLQDMRLL